MSPRLLSALCLLAAGAGFQSASLLTGGASQAVRGAAGQPVGEVAGRSPTGRDAIVAPASATPGARGLRSLREAPGMSDATTPADVKLCLMEAVNKLGPEELAELLSREADTTNLFRTIQPDFEYAARRLSEIAPEKARELWLKRKGALLGGEALLTPWAKQHPEDFVSWSLGLPADAQKAAAGVLGELARENPSLFASLAPRLEQSPGGVAGARLAIRGLFKKQEATLEDSTAALAYAKALPEGSVRNAALIEAAQAYEAYGLEKGSLALNPDVREAIKAIGPAEARNVGKQFAAAAEKLPQGPVRESALSAQINMAAHKDPQAAAKKVEALSGSADYPAAVRGFVEATAAKDPAAALDWALSIGTQGAQRTAALEKAAAEYFRKSPDEARKWVASAPLSAEEYFLLTGSRR